MPKRYAIGVDLGGTNLRVALVSGEGEVVKRLKEPSTGDVAAALKRAVSSLSGDGAEGVGLGVAGLIDREAMTVVDSPNLPALSGVDFDGLGLGLPVAVENDANAAALGELWMGAGRKYEDFVLMTLGTGIGGGIVQGGKLLPVAAEVGHMSIAGDGEKCPCGNFGCLENYASARAMVGAAREALEAGVSSMLRECCEGSIYRISPEDIHLAAMDGDGLAREILKDAGRRLGVGIANMINLMSPRAVILTGGLTNAWDIYVAEAVKEAGRRDFSGLFEKVKILKSTLGAEDAGVLGAAWLVLYGKENA
jgi:glucokinase